MNVQAYPGAPHGFQIAQQSELYRRSLRDTDEWLAGQLSRGGNG